MTSERTHLSIGEVLSLLQPDFPDITISKIRFLESQGLLDPERTPSGYRKFHDDDIEQLRWILTQQRDHFLPLKVIKERLAAGDLGAGAPEGVLPLGADRETASVGAVSATEGGSGAAARAGRAGGAGPTGADGPDPDPDPTVDVADGAEATDGAQATEGRAGDDRGGDGGADEGGGAPEPAADPVAEIEADDPGAGATDDPSTGNGAAVEDEHDRAEAVGRLVEAPGTDTTDEEPDGDDDKAPVGRRRHPTGHQPGEPTPEPADGASEAEPELVVRSIDLDELTELSGLSPREVGELERYGLITPDSEGQPTTYDEECLVVARLAAGFGRYGIEPRHLRMYKVAAEREAGLFEQLISPLLKQRRPSARQQAVEMLEDLAELADDLRAAMVRSALRDYLGGT